MARMLEPLPADARRIGVLPAAFNPVTVAHLALADAAVGAADLDAVVFALPSRLPHKSFHGATLEQRIGLLEAALADRPHALPAVAQGGLMHEIVAEVRALAADDSRCYLICGRDAAERIAGWDYGDGPSFAEQLRRFDLLVGARCGAYRPPAELRESIRCFELEPEVADVSSSALRDAVAAGEPWEHWVPPAVAERIRREGLYRRSTGAAVKA